ncbi:hypothetical protein [cf. Phormidesmis sp. LEGE 11477]|uniref:hypothetical protein n=1 Tax=cf. Phormidesmis sp. LEGE 11477 TaxID=1828680 RepID=UPI001880EFB5|nr:hypothetical protein [cf. Phormidesmis sp. LEGE 11477]MBE9062629.1 hypothetical protein [cf. Phormidesmis sp. LEGE 11477]
MHSSVQTLLESTYAAETIGEARERLGEVLGLDGAATTAVTLRVLAEAKFAEKLVAVRKFPDWRDRLLADPTNSAFEPMDQPADEQAGNARPAKSTVELVKKSSVALLRWGAAGFQKTDPVIVEKRRSACLSCDQLVDSPNSFPYQFAQRVFAGSDQRICAACGCVAAKKILMATEVCPLADPEDLTLTRWGEPIS